jgi:hypothetical protein
MGEAKRRADRLNTLQTALNNAHKEGQGIWTVEIYHSREILNILMASLTGDAEAVAMSDVVSSIIQGICNPPLSKATPILCLLCDVGFSMDTTPPEGFAVLKAAGVQRGHRTSFLLCERCYHTPGRKERVFAKLRESLMPDARELTISEPGNA